MTPEYTVQVVREALMMAFWLSAPLLAVGFAAGVVMSLIQIVTSIQDAGFSAIPRLIAFLAALLFSLPWMLNKMITYAAGIFGNLGHYAR